jgi:hypothetical protein
MVLGNAAFVGRVAGRVQPKRLPTVKQLLPLLLLLLLLLLMMRRW